MNGGPRQTCAWCVHSRGEGLCKEQSETGKSRRGAQNITGADGVVFQVIVRSWAFIPHEIEAFGALRREE